MTAPSTADVLAGIRATRDADQRTRLDALLRRWATC